jgi:DNA-binding LacI/PurR family transcriptional regulator
MLPATCSRAQLFVRGFLGRESVAILLNNIENQAQDIRRVSFIPRLVVRKSVRNLPA